MNRWPIGVAALGLAALIGLASRPTAAGNTEHPRTPVVWPDGPCIRTVDRSVDPIFEFAYSIPFEDTLLSVDELDDSRTHQFIGFCRQWPAGRPPPRYVSVGDLERAVAAGFEELAALAEPESTLETSVEWAGCWTTITTQAERRPITFAAAAAPVVWDTSTLALGTWLIAGYTWEPPYNLWSRAPFVVRTLDQDPPLAPVQPAASMIDTADSLYFDESLDVAICVDADAGATVTLEWVASKTEPVVWSPLTSVELEAAGEQTVTLPFVPPEPSWGATVLLRATVEAPGDLAYAAYALAPVIVYKPADAGDESGESESGGDDSSGSEESGDPGETGESAGASAGRCSVDPERGNLPAALFGLGLLALWIARKQLL